MVVPYMFSFNNQLYCACDGSRQPYQTNTQQCSAVMGMFMMMSANTTPSGITVFSEPLQTFGAGP